MPPHRALVVALSLSVSFVSAAVAAPSAPIQITACGQQIPNGKTGFLAYDLTCPTNDNTAAVVLGRKSKLDLGGFTLTGGDVSVACAPVLCDELGCRSGKSGRCEVSGGTITGASRDAVVGGSITLRNVMIINGGTYAALAFANIDVFDSQIVNTRNGLQGRRVRVYSTTLDKSSINARKVTLTSSSVVNNINFGVVGRDIRLFSSSVIGNGSTCPPDLLCADLYTEILPRLDATSTCGTSAVIDNGPAGTWGVCTLD